MCIIHFSLKEESFIRHNFRRIPKVQSYKIGTTKRNKEIATKTKIRSPHHNRHILRRPMSTRKIHHGDTHIIACQTPRK
jgi:hypothetical protein